MADKDPPLDLSVPLWGVPVYAWIGIVIGIISVIVAVYAVTRRTS